MNKARRAGTIYTQSWKTDPEQAFSAGRLMDTNEKLTDLFDDFVVRETEIKTGADRYAYPASHSNHPTFKEGVLYAIPIADPNKPYEVASGEVIVTDNIPMSNDDELHEALYGVIEDHLEMQGKVVEGETVLGDYTVETSNPDELAYHDEIAVDNFMDNGKTTYLVMVDGEFHSIHDLSVNHANFEKSVLMADLRMSMPYVPGYGPEPKIEIREVSQQVEIPRTVVSRISYGKANARIYKVSEDHPADGWAFYGIPVEKGSSTDTDSE